MIRTLRYYVAEGTDPYENLAVEQFLTETIAEDECVLYLWQNQNTVVIGRNQNAWQECRTTELEHDGGHLARRLSGGGAVFHDLGNLNFTFCVRTKNYDLRRQQSVIVEACRRLSISAEISGRNDVLSQGRKFSGNSFYSHEGCSFHNGTLLLCADTEMLGKYLSPSKAKLKSKGVASVRSRILNLCELQPTLTVSAMEEAMIEAFEEIYGLEATPLVKEDMDAERVATLREKFSSWDWIYGKSVPCSLSCGERFAWGEITIELAVKDGICSDAAVWTDSMDESFAAPLSAAFVGCRMSTDELCRKVRSTNECKEVAEDICALLQSQNI